MTPAAEAVGLPPAASTRPSESSVAEGKAPWFTAGPPSLTIQVPGWTCTVRVLKAASPAAFTAPACSWKVPAAGPAEKVAAVVPWPEVIAPVALPARIAHDRVMSVWAAVQACIQVSFGCAAAG